MSGMTPDDLRFLLDEAWDTQETIYDHRTGIVHPDVARLRLGYE